MKKILNFILSLFSQGAISQKTPQTAYAMMKKDEAVIVDVREIDEMKQGMVKGAKPFPLSKINEDKNWKEDFLKLTKDKTIFLYCRSGVRSEKVKVILQDNGIPSQNIGGFLTLKNELPVEEYK